MRMYVAKPSATDGTDGTDLLFQWCILENRSLVKPPSLPTILCGQNHLTSLASPSPSRHEMSHCYTFLCTITPTPASMNVQSMNVKLDATWPLQWLRSLRICIPFITILNEVLTYDILMLFAYAYDLLFRINNYIWVLLNRPQATVLSIASI